MRNNRREGRNIRHPPHSTWFSVVHAVPDESRRLNVHEIQRMGLQVTNGSGVTTRSLDEPLLTDEVKRLLQLNLFLPFLLQALFFLLLSFP